MLIEGISQNRPNQYLPSMQLSAGRSFAIKKQPSDQLAISPTSADDQQEVSPASIENLHNRLEKISETVKFEYHEKTKRMMVKIVEQGSDRVITELPSRKVLDVVAGLLEHQSTGLIVDYRA